MRRCRLGILHRDDLRAPFDKARAASFLYRRQNRSISENVRENQCRNNERRAFNDRVSRTNQARLDRRLLIITPASGFTR